MLRSIILAATAACLFGCATTKRTEVQAVGLSFIPLPGWQSGKQDDFFYEFKGPEGQITFHYAGSRSRTPEEALQRSIELQNELRRTKPSSYRFTSSEKFTTSSGLTGVLGRFGKMEDGRPAVIRYYVANAKGKIVAICNHSCYSKSQHNQDLVERSILQTVEQID